jgi:sarcosine oxidase subunit alpha
MTRAFRTSEGGRIDRTQTLRFTFDGKAYGGFTGDTVASALLANGVHLVARSFKYHRPRGILTIGSEEPNALVQIGEGAHAIPNSRATQVALYDGLAAFSQNTWPSLRHDAGALTGLFGRLLPAGFYYKTFMRPKGLWEWYERPIRAFAGMGRTPTAPDPDIYDKRHAHCGVLVVGGGPAGLAAALAAGRSGARVILADEQDEFGGGLLNAPATIDGGPASDWADAAIRELAAMDEVRLLPRATVFGYYDHNYLGIVERVADHLSPPPPDTPRQRLWTVRAQQVVLATGAHERPLVFADNDRPGIMLAGAMRGYLHRYGVRAGDRVLLFTNNDSAYPLAVELIAAGSDVAAIVDLRAEPSRHPAAERLGELRVTMLRGHAVIGTGGGQRIRAARVMPLSEAGDTVIGASREIPCDVLAMSGGWTPAVHLFSQAQGTLRFDDTLAAFLPDQAAQAVRCAGAVQGVFGLGDTLAAGSEAGKSAAADAGFAPRRQDPPVPTAAQDPAGPMRHLAVVPSNRPVGMGGKHFVDFQTDVTAADIELAAREGYVSVEHLKRYTTAGMGTDQGKTGNLNTLAVLSQRLDAAVSDVGVTTFRPPYTPVTFGALAGRDIGPLYSPARRTPMQGWHEAAGAVFEDVGDWRRPYYYPRAGESKRDAVDREVRAVRERVGILDASTLGKIDIKGPDALTLLEWVYSNDWATLAEGRCRYGLMCGEDGMVFDDGVTARLDPEHFLMHTTSGNADRVLAWIEEWLQTEWPDLKVYCTSVTDQFATVAVAGPQARRLLGELTDDIDLDADAFPFMAVREGHIAGIPARVFRVSYTGELSYEINVPANYGMALWQALRTAGAQFGIAPFGTEAMHVLRAEKGFILVGQETDGTATPLDLGMGWAVSKRKDFLGKRSLSRADMTKPDRKQLVGLLTDEPEFVLPEGACIVEEARPKPPMASLGHVTSAYFSPTLGRSIALALLRGGHGREGEALYLPLEDGRAVRATVTGTAFYDPDGSRLHG